MYTKCCRGERCFDVCIAANVEKPTVLLVSTYSPAGAPTVAAAAALTVSAAASATANLLPSEQFFGALALGMQRAFEDKTLKVQPL